ncbi:MAG TPA: SGNH/GDSL hydrolase family protein [Puia sp.]|nr:SGNH/GDSL hydrolase family protein [Puia sp.]
MKRILFFALMIPILTGFQHRPVVWVAVGDSITYLNDHPDETKFRIHKGYLTDVTEKIPWLQYRNQGRNGWTVQRFATEIDSLHIPAGDVYTVFLGTNDWWHGTPLGTWGDYEDRTGAGTVYGSFRILIDKLHQLNAAAPIILITPMQRGDFVYINDPNNNAWGSYRSKDGQSLQQVANAVMDIGRREHLDVVDLYDDSRLSMQRLVHYKRLVDPGTGKYRDYSFPAYTTIPYHPATDAYPYPAGAMDMTFDGLHPSDKGHEEIAKKILSEFRKLIH